MFQVLHCTTGLLSPSVPPTPKSKPLVYTTFLFTGPVGPFFSLNLGFFFSRYCWYVLVLFSTSFCSPVSRWRRDV